MKYSALDDRIIRAALEGCYTVLVNKFNQINDYNKEWLVRVSFGLCGLSVDFEMKRDMVTCWANTHIGDVEIKHANINIIPMSGFRLSEIEISLADPNGFNKVGTIFESLVHRYAALEKSRLEDELARLNGLHRRFSEMAEVTSDSIIDAAGFEMI